MVEPLRFRRYDPRDSEAIVELHKWAMRDAGADPADIPGTEDLEAVESTYLETGGEFLVGISSSADAQGIPHSFDGRVVAMGGFLPNEHGHDDERTVPGSVELHRMRVAPPVQGNGYGRTLLVELESRVDDAYDCLLATTSQRQQQAVALYEDAGYQEVERSKHGKYELIHFEKPV